jgi:hypothetical protein
VVALRFMRYYSAMKFEGFITTDFNPKDFTPKNVPGFVYILCGIVDGEEVPFYVGETHSVRNRLNDYYWADFQASTDFKVGEAVKYLCDVKKLRVIAKIKASVKRIGDQNEIIATLHQEGKKLLNDCEGYNYKTANQEAERSKIQQFVDLLFGGRPAESVSEGAKPIREE